MITTHEELVDAIERERLVVSPARVGWTARKYAANSPIGEGATPWEAINNFLHKFTTIPQAQWEINVLYSGERLPPSPKISLSLEDLGL